MADSKISGLSAAGALAGTEEAAIVQSSTTVRVSVQDIADLATSTNIYNSSDTITDSARVVTLAGDTSSEYLRVNTNAGNAIAEFNGDREFLIDQATEHKVNGAGTHDVTLGGSLSTDIYNFQTGGGTDIMQIRGDNAIAVPTGVIGIGASAVNSTVQLKTVGNSYGLLTQNATVYGVWSLGSQTNAGRFETSKASGTGILAQSTGTTGTNYGVDCSSIGSGATTNTALRVNATGATNNNAIFVTDGDIGFGTLTGTKIGTTTSQKFGFWNTTPITQPAALTAQLTNITGDITPVTPDYVVTATSGGWGFGSQDEFETAMNVINNLQTRVQELEDALSTAAGGSGLIA